MIKLSLTLVFILFSQSMQAQNGSYEALWKGVAQLENDGLTQSAVKAVRDIAEKAKKEQHAPQQVKSLLHLSKYAMVLEEEAQLKVVNDFKSAIGQSAFSTKNVLESYLANLYWQYFQQNRYRFYDRTHTESKVDSIDFRTWDLNTIFSEISLHFDNSLHNPAGLQAQNLADYTDVLVLQEGSQTYRPTLFDLLAHTALDFYKSGENAITRPADIFEIDDPGLLCEAEPFTQLHIESADTTSMQLRALQLYQRLVQLHHGNPDAFADVDLARLKYTHQHATFDQKDQQLLQVLQNSAEAHKGKAISTLYRYEIAALYYQWADTYQPKTDTVHQWKRKEALEICESIIRDHPKSAAAEKSKALKATILNRSLQLTSENFLPLDTPSRLLVNYRNVDRLYFTAYIIPEADLKKLNQLYKEEEELAFIQNLKMAKQWEASLHTEGDHQTHSTEVLMPELANGHYIILAVPAEKGDASFAYSAIQVTNLALVTTENPDYHGFQLIDRNNGKPIAGATLRFTYQKDYDNPFLNKTLITDTAGSVTIPLTKEYWSSVSVKATTKEDTAHFGNYYINRKNDEKRKPQTTYKSFLFTDRSIYRPGQPVYFKGILLENFEGKSVVAPEENIIATLYDVNEQEVGELDLQTNDFGSFQGEFILPSNGLTGEYYIEVFGVSGLVEEDYYFSVEEYKRPKFETSFEPIKETYKVNDSITVTGKAMAYAGSAITGAKVAYKVQRVVQFPGWHYWGRPSFPYNPQEIAHGETTTDASGAYQIPFMALPDNTASKENLPIFSYEITADVTDINGETHSATTVVRIGYHALTATIGVSGNLDKDARDSISIGTHNLNGQFVPAKGKLKIYKLQAPEHVLRKRPWEAPDYPLGTKTEFKTQFPHDAYGKEDDPQFWEKGDLVWETDFDTEKSTAVALGSLKKWASGNYVIELETQDKFGQPVTDKALTMVYGSQDKKPADNQLFEIKTDKQAYAPGDQLRLTLASNMVGAYITVAVEKDRKRIDTQIISLNAESKSITVPVRANDLGGFAIHYSFSAYNAFTSGNVPVYVPYPKTDLNIETVTFRDRLQPGVAESWTFNIKGPKGDKVAAELLATMYDASLDAFKSHDWSFYPLSKPNYYTFGNSHAHNSYGLANFRYYETEHQGYPYAPQQYDALDWFGLYFGNGGRLSIYKEHISSRKIKSVGVPEVSPSETENDMEVEETVIESSESSYDEPSTRNPIANAPSENPKKETDFGDVQIRKNLQETAFFFPQLRTDAAGNVSFTFTTPEALTKWKVRLLAHTKDLESAVATLETVTQKELMVLPNAPRFLREGDELTFSSKMANLSDKKLSGSAKLELTDALTGLDITDRLLASQPAEAPFTVDAKGNAVVTWQIKVPEGLQAVQYKVMAKAGDFGDGEQNTLPVLTNRMLVTETLPMWVRSDQTKTFVLDKLRANSSTTLKNHKLILEITSNPAWYAVQALPYLMEYPYECNEQIFSRYYANTLASHIANSNPRIREVFDLWANSDALLSNLEKNEELKSLLIQETPWLRDAQSETEQKKRIALLFNLNKMNNGQATALDKLKTNQMTNGAWAWFQGGRSNRFITQHIVTGLGHLKNLKVLAADKDTDLMAKKGIAYLDAEFVEEYEQMKKQATDLNDDHLSATQIHYLYMRSFFRDIKTSKKVEDITAYYQDQAKRYWTNKGLYSKGMLALILHRRDDKTTTEKILRSLKENSITSEELGMYWKENTASWYWYQAPIETQALMIEAFSEIRNEPQTVDNLKVWLLKNKQTSQWKTTKATTEAVYALLLQGSDWLSVTEAVDVLIAGEKIALSKLADVKVEAGTGYYKTSWSGDEIQPDMAQVQLGKKGDGIAWGALYWQYFEDLDKITPAETPLKIEKKLFLKKNTALGEQLSEITPISDLKVGDLVRVRIELRADRAMEFVHMKDMRASGLEPINVLSTYKWQDGLGYYESTKDASTNFFFDYLPKGIYVFEYDLRVNNAGDFSNGITTIQSMYAPEFSGHSEGVRIAVKE